MAKIRFREIRMSRKNRQRLNHINQIIEEYQKEGYVLTLRQLYYQLVSRDIIPNIQREYAKLSTLLKEGRMAGIVDWDAIEDRLRKPHSPSSFDSPMDIINAAIRQYARPRQEGQETYLEVWVEKDALSGVLKRVTERYHVPILVNRGYSSVSAMFDSYERFEQAFTKKQKITILYLGDFDPSGIDMIRDIRERITEFLIGGIDFEPYFEELGWEQQKLYIFPYQKDQGLSTNDSWEYAIKDYAKESIEKRFTVKPIALTMDQINKYSPPPNPAKVEDPRAKQYIAKYGNTSWEVDALNPETLNNLLDTSIVNHIDIDLYQSIVEKEEADKKNLLSLKKYL